MKVRLAFWEKKFLLVFVSIYMASKNYRRNLLAGSHKLRFYLQVDVETILSALIAIHLQHSLKRLAVEKK